MRRDGHPEIRVLVCTALVLWLASLLVAYGQNSKSASPMEPSPSAEERERLLDVGKKLFVERCSSCHAERGEKPLRIGPPLNERTLSADVIARAVNGRLKDATPEQRQAVNMYIISFMRK